MPHAPTSPLSTDRPGSDAQAPAVHLTRRARIEAERAAAKQAVQRVEPLGGAPVSAQTVGSQAVGGQAAMPVTPSAPASPVLPASTLAPETPPAPSSPDVAPASARLAPRRPEAARPAAGHPVAPPVRPAAPRSTPQGARIEAARVDRATRHLGAGRATSRPATAPQHGSAFRRNASRVTALGALLFVAGLVVSTSLPAQALYTPEPGSTSNQGTTVAGETQSLRVGDAAEAETNRDAYTVSDATQYKNVDSSSFTNDPTGTIQWPFLTGVPITSGFGGRQVEGCSFCSTNHQGVDFAPGEGTPIRVIAAGTVIKVQADDGGFGNDVWVEHDVDGKQFTSVYGHMEDDSFKVVEGQHVEVGDELGLVGSTGNSTGPHLHLEIHLDGVPVDPLAWLKANAN